MTSQFWWGLAMLPLGALALAITIFVPWFILAWIGDRRSRYRFVMKTKRGPRKDGFHTLAAVVAIADKAIGLRLPVGWRILIVRDRPGARPDDPDCRKVVWGIEDAIKSAQEEAE